MLQIVKMDLMSKIVQSNVFILTRFLMVFSSEHMIGWFQWQCSDQLSCIKQDQRCDGIRHCKDNSDEGDCQKPPIIKVSLTPTQLYHLRNYTTRESFLKNPQNFIFQTKNVISWSILAAGLIVSLVLMVFCILNRKRSSNNPSNPQINIPLPHLSNRDNTNITISITTHVSNNQ